MMAASVGTILRPSAVETQTRYLSWLLRNMLYGDVWVVSANGVEWCIECAAPGTSIRNKIYVLYRNKRKYFQNSDQEKMIQRICTNQIPRFEKRMSSYDLRYSVRGTN